MIVMIILILLAGLVAGSIESNLMDAFSGDWMQFDEPQEPKAITPAFHTPEFIKQMKSRLYSKDKQKYERYAEYGESDCNWYWSPTQQKWLVYREGKLIETRI